MGVTQDRNFAKVSAGFSAGFCILTLCSTVTYDKFMQKNPAYLYFFDTTWIFHSMPYLLTGFYYRTQTTQTYADLARAVLVLPSGWSRKRSTRASCLNSRLSSC